MTFSRGLNIYKTSRMHCHSKYSNSMVIFTLILSRSPPKPITCVENEAFCTRKTQPDEFSSSVHLAGFPPFTTHTTQIHTAKIMKQFNLRTEFRHKKHTTTKMVPQIFTNLRSHFYTTPIKTACRMN